AALDVADSQRAAAALQLEATGASGSAALVAAASLAVARAELASAESALDRTRIRSPIEGVVTSRMVDPGDSVQPGARLFVVSGVGRTRLVIEPDERNLALLAAGQVARASAEAFPKDRFSATVGYIAPAVDARRGTIEVRLDVDSPPAHLRPDMTVSVEVEVARKAAVLVLPIAAVHELSGERPWVLSLEGGRTSRRDVTLGLVGDGEVEVESGVAEGELVVASAATALAPGARARAKEH
ncbi:MAG: efflux RND transporter periplasmic adaptor subunit, partial [Deltaproteobacteria bacterium]|nr:efflux RND transporter periplasmic adaptor subunit [Deltaproteobacteria bacterium]